MKLSSEILLSAAAGLTLVSAVGLVVMKDTFQRLHFSSVIVGVCVPFATAAIWIETSSFQARSKSIMVAVFLFFTNAILTHATARCARLRLKGHWDFQVGDSEIEKVKA